VRGSTKEVDEINRQLKEQFGSDSDSRDPIWRVVWSDDQIENRMTEWSEEGFHLLTPRMALLPKYSWIKARWILERLVLVPEMNRQELLGKTKSYEVIWVFETQEGQELPANYRAAKFVIDGIYAAQGKASMRKYVDDAVKDDNREGRIAKLTEELFGNETPVGDALAHGDGVGYTGPTFEEKK
jgi:hypothetical protein